MANDININVVAQVQGAIAPLRQVEQQVRRVGGQVDRSTAVVRNNAMAYSRNGTQLRRWAKGALQQAGFQVGDFAVQVANGTNGIQAFGQQGSQLLGIFGPIGAVLGAAVAIFSAVAVAASKSGQEVQNLGAALGVLEQPVMAIADGVRSLGSLFDGFGQALLNNIDTLIIFAGVLGVNYVRSTYLATGGVLSLSRALDTLRVRQALAAMEGKRLSLSMVAIQTATVYATAAVRALGAVLMRFLPIAVMMGIAKLIEMFLQLVRGADGFMNALNLLGMVVAETVQRMIMRFDRAYSRMSLGAQNFKLTFISGLRSIAEFFDNFVEGLASRWNASFGKFEPLRIDIGEGMSGVLEDMETSTQQTINRINGHIQSIDEALARPNQSLQDLIDAFKAGEISASIFGDRLAEELAGSGGVGDTLDEVAKKVKALEQSISSSMEDAFMSIVDGTKSTKDAFKAMAADIIKELYRVLVVQQMVGSIMSAMGFGGGGGTSFLSSLFGGFRAQGGAVSANRPYVVGENGPEMLVPSTSGRVIPNNQMAGGGGQPIIVNQTINVSTGVQQTVRTEIKQLMPQIAESAKQAVVDAKRRGGSYGKAFA